MSNETKSMVARLQATMEETGKAKAADNAGHRAHEVALQDIADLEGQYRQVEARLEEDPLGAVKELARLQALIDDARKVAERVRAIAEAKHRATRGRYMDCLGDENAARTDLVKAISADATRDLDNKAIRQLVRGWAALGLATNTRPPWFAYVNSVLSEPGHAEINAMLKELEREFPILANGGAN